jgi:hypothetical protein
MPAPFEPLRETLLRAGVAPLHVRRYLSELSDHLSDLVAEETKAGRTAAEVKAAARARLGGEDALAQAMLAQPSLRSWTGRAPWATLVIGPFLMLILAWLLASLVIIALIGYPAHNIGLSPPRPVWMPPEWLPREWQVRLGTALLDLVQVCGPLLIAGWVALLAAGQRSRLIWPLLGCAVVAVFGASLIWHADWPAIDPRDPVHRVSWGLAIGFRGDHLSYHHHAFSVVEWSPSLVMAAFNLAVAAAVYGITRRRTSEAA